MTHNEIWKAFKRHFTYASDSVTYWFPNGRNSIRVRLANNTDMIFTYKNKKVWRIETVDSFLESIKVEAE